MDLKFKFKNDKYTFYFIKTGCCCCCYVCYFFTLEPKRPLALQPKADICLAIDKPIGPRWSMANTKNAGQTLSTMLDNAVLELWIKTNNYIDILLTFTGWLDNCFQLGKMWKWNLKWIYDCQEWKRNKITQIILTLRSSFCRCVPRRDVGTKTVKTNNCVKLVTSVMAFES